MRVKICGITRSIDAVAAAEAGADFLGFNFFAGSPRYVAPAVAAELIRAAKKVRPEVVCGGVFVNAEPAEVATIVAACGLNFVQLAGAENPADFAAVGAAVWPTVRTTAANTGLQPFVFDAKVTGAHGGTGQLADWQAAKTLAKKYQFLLAGGLTPANVAAASAAVQPWGVDTASGVEITPGKKCAEKMRTFVAAAKNLKLRFV